MSTDTHPAIPTTAAPTPPRRPKRRWSRAQRAIVWILGLAALGVFAVVAFLAWTESKIDRIPDAELVSLAEITPASAGEPINFLVVGTDDRSAIPDDWDLGYYGRFTGKRADVIMIAHLIPGERIQILSIPRDLKVSIPGNGTNRINAAYVVGGPDLLVQVIQNELGIPIHHYVEIGFGGVGRIVDSLGGVTLDFPEPGRDQKSGFRIDAGTHTLDGEQAVAYARSRHYEVLRDGQWKSTPGGDIARTQRQQQIIVQLFDQITSPSSAFNLPTFLPTVADQITADEGLTLGLMADLGQVALTLRTGDIERTTLPVRNTRGSDGRAYVEPTPEAQVVIDAFLAGDPYP